MIERLRSVLNDVHFFVNVCTVHNCCKAWDAINVKVKLNLMGELEM